MMPYETTATASGRIGKDDLAKAKLMSFIRGANEQEFSIILKLLKGLYNSEDRTGGLTSQSKIVSASSDHTIRVWDATTGKEEDIFIGYSDTVTSVAVSPDRRIIASGSADRIVRLWDTTTGRQIRVLTGHTNTIRSVVFSYDGVKLASGSDNSTVLVWHLATGKQERSLSHSTATAAYGYYGNRT
ncbi:hypothetical protein TGAM01_v204218 [Trichoderma gamsii]|uniref:Uncharacterized protein n=1 Tax=Trichoderma gamsii TaxID=398673 RepID=A0A2P4ZQZ2_9HYPO|nr:hypothetical protein TGAM01_v204218 [Trichoderma gamsii]PON26717.1 hypothetical protein TGAM01_v204218 [Trichoderma gamsii]